MPPILRNGATLYGTPKEDKSDLLAGFAAPVATTVNEARPVTTAPKPAPPPEATPPVNNPAPAEPGENAFARADTGSLNTSGPANSREAANSSYSNFEDIFNKNKTYTAQYRADIRNRMGNAPSIPNIIPGTVARTGVAADSGAQAAPGFSGIPPKTATSTPINQNAQVTSPPKPPDAGNPFTSGTQKPSQTAPPSSTGTSKNALNDASPDPFSGFTNSNGKKSTPQPTAPATAANTTAQNTLTGGAAPTLTNLQAGADSNRQGLISELNALPTGATDAERAESRRLGDRQLDLNALKSDGGQSVLDEIYGGKRDDDVLTKVDPMDAALFQTGGGRSDIARYNKEFDGAQQKYDESVGKKYDAVEARRKELQNELNAPQPTNNTQAATPATTATTPVSSEGDYQGDPTQADAVTYMFGTGKWDDNWEAGKALTHAMTMTIGIDQANMSLAEATNNDWPMISEKFVGNFDSGPHTAWKWGNIMVAIQRRTGWGTENLNKFITAMKNDPALKQQFMSYQNPGFMANRIDDWMRAHGLQPPPKLTDEQRKEFKVDEKRTSQAEGGVKAAPDASGKQDASDSEIELTLSLGKPYTDPKTGRTFTSLTDWYTFKRTGK